jgi:peptide/nickel transport system ATP-binding protein
MRSIPRVGATGARLEQIDGAMPRLDAIPPGCAFHPRCPQRFERCDRERPALLATGDRLAACWLYADDSSR